MSLHSSSFNSSLICFAFASGEINRKRKQSVLINVGYEKRQKQFTLSSLLSSWTTLIITAIIAGY